MGGGGGAFSKQKSATFGPEVGPNSHGSHNFVILLSRIRLWIHIRAERQIRIRIKIRKRIQICIKLKVKEQWRLKWRHGEPWTLTMEAWRVCMPGVADLHHFDDG